MAGRNCTGVPFRELSLAGSLQPSQCGASPISCHRNLPDFIAAASPQPFILSDDIQRKELLFLRAEFVDRDWVESKDLADPDK
jgi:hypothetical protein